MRKSTGDAAYSDVNYVFPTFITDTHADRPASACLIAAILAAAMSTIAGELSALSTATVIDFYRRFVRAEASDRALPACVAGGHGLLGPVRRASSPCGPPSSARSSRSSIASARSSTARSLASSSWPSGSRARRPTARSSACSPAWRPWRWAASVNQRRVSLAQRDRRRRCRHRRDGRQPGHEAVVTDDSHVRHRRHLRQDLRRDPRPAVIW